MSRALQERLLLLVGAVALAAALVASYASHLLTDSSEFADRAAVAFDQPEVRAELTEAIVTEMVDAAPELVAAQPLLIAVVDGVLATDTANSLLRAAVDDLHRTLFSEDDDTIILTVSDLILVAKSQITALNPELGARIPDDLTESVIEAREQTASADVAQFLEGLDLWIYVLVAVAGAAFVAALWRVPNAGEGLVGIGLALIGASVFMLLIAILGRWLLLDASEPAAVAVWDAFAEPFDTWILTVGGLGAMLAAIAWYGVDDTNVSERTAQIARLLRRRTVRHERVIWGTAVTIAGLVVLVNAGAVLRLTIATTAVFVIIVGLREVFLSLFPSLAQGVSERRREVDADAPEHRDRRSRLVASTLIVALAVAGGVAIARGGGDEVEAVSTTGCNGSDEACSRRLDEVTLAATHNSNAAAGAGFLNGYQTFDIERQLDDGIRGLLIDVYFGFDDGRGLVVTDRAPLTPDERADLVADVGEAAVNAAEATRNSFAASGVAKEMFLCHALCEIGASRFVDVLTTIRQFLDDNPREVLVIVIQDEGPLPADINVAFEQSGLIEYVHAQEFGEPFPTLGEMVEQNERVFVAAENRAGDLDWYHDAFTFVQDTEFKFDSIDDFDCELNRGTPESPLLLVNHWVSPVSPTGSEQANQADVLRSRFDDCVSVREMLPNLIAVDFYERGDLLDFVAALD